MNTTPGKEEPFRKSTQFVAKGKIRKRWKRSMGLAHGRTQSELVRECDFAGKSAFSRAKDYLEIQWLKWACHYLKSRFGGKWKFADYAGCEHDKGIYDLSLNGSEDNASGTVKVSLAGDWGSGTKDAHDVGVRVSEGDPDFTIHLGDVYYVGTKNEIHETMLGGRVHWPLGSRGSFSLNANHEMYARGKAYFTYLLPALGIRNGVGGIPRGQKASFFCLRNEFWLVLGLDTGYYSVGLPILEHVVKPSCKLHDEIMRWLRQDVQLQNDKKRGIVLLSHHQYYSQFESGYERAAKQLAELVDRPVLWFWGHEHRFAIYGKHATRKGRLHAYGRCIGHGGLPIEDIEDNPKRCCKRDVGLVLFDRRKRKTIGSTGIGFNGYANLLFEGRGLTVEYYDTQQLLATEKWNVGDRGLLKGVSFDLIVNHPDLVVHNGATLEDAVA